MQCTLSLSVIAVIAIIFSINMTQGAPISSSISSESGAILSPTDISGEAVRQKRASAAYYRGDYFICYPKSEVYGNAYGGSQRRSDDSVASPPRYLADDSFEARKDRADARRAAYTDSYGK
ncbi:uncharacterized protein LOC117581313 [Drosophila guanche]|uniref:Secreted protein n=1 Tax=Drosophila guanche TaxID=7266 RepID=A0A3B0JGT0_DROGU|nr:uncharacterized protein LOC117581313 [Drosophila guanche]SPP74570.1 Hypothetical predicted protein [Drosophila guanche]